MSDDSSEEPKGLSPLAIVALVAVSIPMVFSMASSSSRTVNGVVVEASYFDPVAVFAGAVGVLAALLLGAIGRGGRLGRWVMALVLMAVGARHVVHGLGIEVFPGSSRGGAVATSGSGSGNSSASCDEDRPEPCQALCDQGDGDACDVLGVVYATGESLPRDDAKAEALFSKACELKERQGCSNAVIFFNKGRAKTIDREKALSFAKQGCTLKNAVSCNFAGYFLADGKGVDGDFAAAIPFYEQACTLGYATGCYNMGHIYRDALGADRDLEKAISFLQKGCDGSEGDACSDLAVLLEDEDRSAEDRERAPGLYARACELKSAFGCANYGHALMKTDPANALDPLDKACSGGRTRACEDLGLLLYTGQGVEKNLPEARRVFERGCELGHGNSCTNLGIMQMDGEGGAADLDEAVENLRAACDLKETKGCLRLGLALASTDPVAAKPVLTASCKEKLPAACDALKKLGKGDKKKGKKK